MKNNSYESFAERYDWMTQKNPAREAFFRGLFRKHNVSDVLDCACGTGVDLIMFHSLGCNVVGSDLSEAMLSQTTKNLAAAEIEIPVKKADFRNLERNFTVQFDGVVCLSNAINEILDESEVHRALQSMKTVLRPGGILVFDQGQSDATMKNPPKYAPILNNRDFSRLFVLEYSKDIMKVNIFDFIHTEERYDFLATTIDVAIRLQDDWDRILAEAGFSKVDYIGDWEFSPYDKNSSKRLIVVARK